MIAVIVEIIAVNTVITPLKLWTALVGLIEWTRCIRCVIPQNITNKTQQINTNLNSGIFLFLKKNSIVIGIEK